MKIHEYQAKELFRNHNIPVPDGAVCTTPAAVTEAADRFGLPIAVKAQVHAGGRGKGGGVRIARTSEEVLEAGAAVEQMPLHPRPRRGLDLCCVDQPADDHRLRVERHHHGFRLTLGDDR